MTDLEATITTSPQEIATANGSEVYVEVLGRPDQPTLILTHGWAMDSTIWHYVKLALGKNFRIILWDLPGLGQSKGPSQLHHVTLLATKNRPANIHKGNLAMFHWDAIGALGKTGVETLLLAGELDIVTKPQASAEIGRQAPRATLRLIEASTTWGCSKRGRLQRRDRQIRFSGV